jgi:hypothetical protein
MVRFAPILIYHYNPCLLILLLFVSDIVLNGSGAFFSFSLFGVVVYYLFVHLFCFVLYIVIVPFREKEK